MYILHNKQDYEDFIKEESSGGSNRHNSWAERELRSDIRPSSYPCAVFVYWGEGFNGSFLVSEIIYPNYFNLRDGRRRKIKKRKT